MKFAASPSHSVAVPADILVLGAGVTGLVAGIALAKHGFAVHLIGQMDESTNGRTVALLDGSVQMLRNLGLWQSIAPNTAALDIMRIVDDTGSLFTIPPVDFKAGEIGLEHFGYNIPLAWISGQLAQAAKSVPGLTITPALAKSIRSTPDSTTVELEDGREFQAKVLVGADGRHSLARSAGNIGVNRWSYPQTAVTATLTHQSPHRNASTEFQTRSGPCTLVPLPPSDNSPNRSSLVWLMAPQAAEQHAEIDDSAFARSLQRQIKFTLGAMQVEGKRGKFPMSGMTAKHLTAHRLALVGEAAHVFPPIGAQGLNLGMRDVAELVHCLTQTGARHDPGAASVLQRYDSARQPDIGLRTMAVDALNRSLLSPFLPVDFMRGAGLAALAHIGPLRRAVMRAGVQPQRVAPLMQRHPALSLPA